MEWVAVLPRQSIARPRDAQLLAATFHDFHTLPVDLDRLLVVLGHAVGKSGLLRSVEAADATAPLSAQAAAEADVKKIAGKASADAQMVQALGAITGCLIAPLIGAFLGRRPAYFLLCLTSLLLCGYVFRALTTFGREFLVLSYFTSLATASFYGWFPLYFPELFPTRVRATGQGLAYNFGRIFAAGGALAQGQLMKTFDGSYAQAGAIVTLIYLVGMTMIWFAPETKGHPLPD
jgi:MFS family permease